MNFGIVRHSLDFDPGTFDNLPPGSYPETVPLNDKPSGGKGYQIPVLPKMWEYIRAINNDAGYDYARSVGLMWINFKYGPNDTPEAESITCSHNFVAWEDEVKGCYKLLAFPYTENLFENFNPAKHNWYTMPHLFFKAHAVNPKTHYHIKPAKTIDCFIPLLKRTELYIPKSWVEPFPALPLSVTVTVNRLNVRKGPGVHYDAIDYLPYGKKVAVLAYALQGASVWGRVDDGWICLRDARSPSSVSELTTWHLATAPVIPPEPYLEPGAPAPGPAPVPFEPYLKRLVVTWQTDEKGTTELEVVE